MMSVEPKADGEPIWKGLEGPRSLEGKLWLYDCPPLGKEILQRLQIFEDWRSCESRDAGR